MVHQVLLCSDSYDIYDAIATNKLCKLNFRGGFHVPTYKSEARL